MKEKEVIVISDRLPGGIPYYGADDLREDIAGLRDLVRMLLREAPDGFCLGVADVMKRVYVLDWLMENAEFKDMAIPEEQGKAGGHD